MQAARLRAKEEVERTQAVQAGLEDEADPVRGGALAKRRRTGAGRWAAGSARESTVTLRERVPTGQTRSTSETRHGREGNVKRKAPEATVKVERGSEQAEGVRASDAEQAASHALLDNLEKELHRVEDHECRWRWGCGCVGSEGSWVLCWVGGPKPFMRWMLF